MSFTLGGVDLDDEDSIEIVNDEHSPVKYSNAQQNQNKTKQQNKLKTKEEHPNKESTKLDLIYTLDQDDEPMHSTRSLKSLRTYGRSKTSNRTSHTTQHNNHNNNNHRNKDNNNHNTNSTSDGDTNHTMTTVPLTHDDPTPHTRHKRARSPDTDTAVTPVKKFRADEAQSFLEKVTERFRAPQTVITMPNKVTVSSEEKKRNNKRVSRDSTDRTKQPAKLGKDGSVFRAGSATQPLAVSDDVTPVKRAPVKHKSRATDQSRDEDSVEVVILNDESPQREIESPSHAFLDMTRDEHEKNSDEKNSDESSSSLDQSFDLFDSQPLTASRDSKIGALPRLALVCLQIDRMVVRDTDVKDAFQLRVKAHHLSVSEVSPSSPPIEIAISELVQVQYSALHRLIVLRLKTVPVSISGFWQNKSKDRPYLVLILAEELSDEHKRHLQSLLSTEQRRLDKYDDRKLKIDLVTEVYEQYIKGRQQGVDLTLSSDHVPLEIRGEIHHSDEARDDTEYHARDSDSPPRSTRILRSSRASVQSAEEIHAEIEHKRANVLCVWPKGARDSVSITELDLARLEPNEFLNDVIIDFYLMWIRDRIVPPKQRNKIYFYNSFFYNLLTRKSQGYNKVKKWTKHVNIFDYDYLVIPINQHFHWRVCIVYHPQRLLSTSTSDDAPYLIMLDSLQGSAGSVYRAIKEYLQKEWQDKQHDSDVTLDMTRLKTVMPKAPTQDNHYDCGIFVLQYVESFCINPVSSPMHITESWFSAKVIARKRREIRAIILKLAEEQGHSIGSTANINHSNNDNTQD